MSSISLAYNDLSCYRLQQLDPIVLLEDNQSCIEYSKNNTAHDRTKHIEIKYHLVREQIQQGNIALAKVPTKKNVADLFWQHMADYLPVYCFMSMWKSRRSTGVGDLFYGLYECFDDANT